jgi:hypothetical protein
MIARIGLVTLLMLPGCSALFPGWDMKEGLGTKDSYDSTSDGAVKAIVEGTQAGQFLHADSAEEGGLTITPADDPTKPPTVTGATSIFWRNSSPQDAATAMQARDQANMQAWLGSLQMITGLVGQVYQQRYAAMSAGPVANQPADLGGGRPAPRQTLMESLFGMLDREDAEADGCPISILVQSLMGRVQDMTAEDAQGIVKQWQAARRK